MENDNDTLTKKILNGWKSLVSGSSQSQKKPFPENRFFSAEQLSFLDKQKKTTLLEKWAIEIGRETAAKSGGKGEFNPVQWSDGLFGSWVDGNPYYVDETKQADYLRMLRDEGYELRPEHEKFILKQEKNSLLGKVLADKDSYLVIEDGNFGQKAESRFTLHSFNKETMGDVEVPFDLDMFHEEMRKGEMKFIGNEEKATFDDKFRQWKDAKALFNNTMRAIEGSQSYKNGGVFPPEMMFGQGNSSLGHYELSSWKSDNNFTIDVNVKLGNSKKTSTIIVSEENAFKYRDLLKDVSNFLAMEQDRPRVERIKSAENIGVAPQSNGEEKLLPKSRYFSIDELESLAKADNPTLLEKWAVELGKHCAEISNFFSSKEYRPVLWNDGKLSSWVDYESWELSDKHNEQNLKQLRAEGYKLDDAVTAEYQKNLGKLLSNKLFADFDDYIKVGNMDKDGTLEILRYDQKTMESTATKMGWQQFVNQVGKNSVRDISNDFLEKDFNNKMQKVNAAKQSFSETIERIKSLDANERSGIFSSEEKDHHYTNLGDYTGVSWEYKNNDTLVYKGFFGDDGDNIQEKVITKDSAYNHRGLLLDINDSIDNKMKASNRLKATSVQGLELYDREDLKNLVVDFFNETFEDTENAPTIKGVEVYGSRARGTANEKSDLDVVIEYEGDWKEDSVFNALHETPFEIEGIKVDINPINRTQSKSLGDFMKEAREYDQDILEKSNAKPRFSLKEDSTSENLDREYMEAIESGDMKKAQQMVNAAAASKGYASSSSYQGTSAFNGAAPWGNAYFDSPKERKEAWESDSEHLEYEGDQTLADYIENGIDAMSLDYIALDQRFYHAANEERKEAILNVRKTIQSKGDTITMYRSVPSSVKEDSFRNGDWVTPSKQYAIDNAAVHGWGDDYRIIEQEVPTNEVWWDGNDIAEWGYGREEDYVNDKDFAYKNTANNKKLLDAVTYDDDGKVIPLSKRFNESIKDIRYQDVSEKKALTMEEVELRETLIDKLRSSGISVVTDTNVGQNVLDRARFFRTEKGEAYGFTANGKIYIDPRIATAETPIHEYTHLWASAMQKGNPKEWQNIVGLMKDTAIWNEVKDRYQDLKGDDDIADEVLATYSGRKGAEKLRQMSQNASAEGNSAARKSSIARAIFQVQQALEKFWKGVSSFLGIHYGSTEEVADRVMKDMLGGINPSSQLKAFTESHNKEYMEAVKDGNMNKAYNLVMEQADMMLASNPMPEVTDAYEMRKTAPPKNTIKVYKVFTLDKDGDPSALFVNGKDKLPMGVWLNAQDTWHFTAENGKQYVPSTKNPSTQGGKTGASIKIPSEEVRQELIKRGYLPEGSKAKSITALAYRPGWHAADLPYFPQGGKQDPESNYGNIHRYNQVVFECELAADIDYTPLARNQTKAFNAKGKLNLRDADLQWMPKEGFYQYTTNQFLPDEEKGHWYIGGSIRINRALTQEECDKILTANGKSVQEWEQDILDLKRLGYVSSLSHVKPTLSPIAYYEDGSIVPLSERFKTFKTETNPQKKLYNPRAWIPSVRGEWTKEKILRRLKEGGWLHRGEGVAARRICEFDSPEELKEHMFYHGTVYGGGKLKPSITMSNRDIERYEGGGYGQKYWGISLTSDKKIASNFSGSHSSIRILPVILVKGATVREMPDLQDAADLEEHIVELWKDGVDAVWIGDKNKGEKELCVLNPSAIVNIDRADSYQVFRIGQEENPLRIIDDAGIAKLYNDAHEYKRILDNKPTTPKEASVSSIPRVYEEKDGALVRKDEQTYQKELVAYKNAKKTFYSSDVYQEYMERENEARSKIRFMFAGEEGARNMDKADGQMLGNLSYRISMLNLAKTMLQDENYERLTKRMAKQDLRSISNFKQEKLIKHATGWELGADGNWRYEIPDIKRFDWNGNIKFEQNHPDYRRYLELMEKDNRHSWLDGEPLTNEERKELDKLSKTYEELALKKLDNNQSLDAYIDAPELFKAYPELRDVKVKFGELAPNTLAKYSRSGNLMDYLLSTDEENVGVKSITFNTGKLNMLSNTDSIKSVICHEIQHAIQDIENFAKGGNLSELREHLQNELKFNQSQRDDIVSHMKVIARYEAAAYNLEILSKASSGSGLDKERSSFLYWSAMDELDKNQEGKFNLKNDFEKVYGKGFDRQKPVDDGYHVTEVISELRRVASEYKSDISQGDQAMAKNLSLIELALERNSNDELYFKMAGEVEARNVEKRMNMTQKERRNSLASETEDVARKEQLVVIQSPVSMDLNLVPTEGRWHNKETQERDMYSHYGEILAGYLKEQSDNGCPWNIAREAIDSEGKKYEDINAYMMDLTNYDTHKYPIYLTEEQVRQEGYTINAKANPMPILQGDKVVEVYNVDGILDKDNHLLTSTNEVHTQYESWLRLNDSNLNSLDVFPTVNYEEFEDLSREKYKESEDFREKLASALVGESRGKLPETPSAASKESFIRLLSTAMLGKKYGFSEVSTVSNPLQLAARLERDPEFVKDVLGEAAKTSCKVGTFVEETIRNWGEDKKLDLRSLNSVDIDEDGNGIVDSQEDLVPETLNESTELKKDEQKEQFHRSRFK